MNKRQIDRSKAITKRITAPDLDRIKKEYDLQDKDNVLNELSQQSVDEILKNIAAAGELLMAAGEDASNLRDMVQKRMGISEERQQILYDRASALTLLANIEYFFNDAEECRKFVGTLTNEARSNLFGVLLETEGPPPK